MSCAFTLTAYQPNSSVAKVTRSLLTLSQPFVVHFTNSNPYVTIRATSNKKERVHHKATRWRNGIPSVAHFLWIADCSGSMGLDGKIQSLNNAVFA
jgi:hypothetical protein